MLVFGCRVFDFLAVPGSGSGFSLKPQPLVVMKVDSVLRFGAVEVSGLKVQEILGSWVSAYNKYAMEVYSKPRPTLGRKASLN